MKRIFCLILITALIHGCADTIIDADPSGNDLKIEIKDPSDNDTLGYKGEVIQYEIKTTTGIYFIELYVNKEFVRNYPPLNNQKPVISFEIDSSYTGRRIELYLIMYNKDGTSHKSNIVKNVFITEDRTLPAPPVNLKVIPLSNTSINLSWEDNSPYMLEYEIWRREGLDGSFIKHITAAGTARNVNDENLVPGITYFYKVRGISKNGISDFSAVINSDGSSGTIELPAPGNLTASVKDFKVIGLSWKDNSTNENYFKIERRRTWAVFETIGYSPANSESYTDSSNELAGGADYFYRIKAVSEKDSSWSNETYVYMPPYILKAPTIISLINSSSGKVTVKWKDNDQQWSDFIIERKINGGNFSEAGTVTGSFNTFQDTVHPGINYTYRIKANDGIYSSAYSDEKSILTQIIPLPAPSDFTGYFDGSSMILSWTYSSEADRFILEKRDSTAGTVFSEIAEIDGSVKTYSDNNTICQHFYIYRLKAADLYSVSLYSPEKIIKNWNNCP